MFSHSFLTPDFSALSVTVKIPREFSLLGTEGSGNYEE